MAVPRSEYLSHVWADSIFTDRVVFVTGGAGSICSAQTRALVHLGANACIVGRNVAKTEDAAKEIAKVRKGARVIGIGGVDVRSFDSLKSAADRCATELGAIDFVIAGAAGNFISPISALSPNGFKAVIEIDTIGTFNTIKATIPHLVQSAARNPNPNPSGATGGRIVAVSATFHYTGMPLQAHVSAAKAAVDSLMASVALEYGPLGITANVVAPGAIAGTEGMERLASSALDSTQRNSGVPTGRWGTVRDIADATVFVFSDAGNYINGTNIVVDGAGWRRHGSLGVGLDPDMKYPDFLITGDISKNVKDGRKAKL
ncbi:NAD(P)-binding protein [Phialemonium atrogriseum]|uniref:2,4-dienoyl-CoA reductase [(3E)-enoyl-CoA-producing] n=1 Tax=Phialemonium atrogriseum TaxID=1093897 RepID=A0AAJ0C7K1_9PEZI|nr:NAD(P)-binding protein [Phialemonium atrogriseum]KAK1771421.1 NAD(P)-binding protein [Phialemonium atrogriseum]